MSIMRYIVQLWSKLFRGRRLQPEREDHGRRDAFEQVLIRSSREALEDLLTPGTLMIVRDGDYDRWIRFACPCGCDQKHTISLQKHHRPYWTLQERNGKVTLSPSVHVTGNPHCSAHFFVRNNRIDWT